MVPRHVDIAQRLVRRDSLSARQSTREAVMHVNVKRGRDTAPRARKATRGAAPTSEGATLRGGAAAPRWHARRARSNATVPAAGTPFHETSKTTMFVLSISICASASAPTRPTLLRARLSRITWQRRRGDAAQLTRLRRSAEERMSVGAICCRAGSGADRAAARAERLGDDFGGVIAQVVVLEVEVQKRAPV